MQISFLSRQTASVSIGQIQQRLMVGYIMVSRTSSSDKCLRGSQALSDTLRQRNTCWASARTSISCQQNSTHSQADGYLDRAVRILKISLEKMQTA